MDLRELTIRDMVHELTGGRPFIFVVMAFDKRWELYDRVKRLVNKEFGIACIRADELKSSGYDLLAKIHFLILRSEVVVAEISEHTANVFYEIGYAVAMNKPPLLLVERNNDADVPADLRGLETLDYTTDRNGLRSLDLDLVDHLRSRMNSQLPLLRDMLEAPIPQPNYIVASPRHTKERPGNVSATNYDRRTYGDNIGIIGLISAFGAIRGEFGGVELISAQASPPDLLSSPLNLYLIGSHRVNPPAERLLADLQKRGDLRWLFEPASGHAGATSEPPLSLYRSSSGDRDELVGEFEVEGEEITWTKDYGIIIRGPHPNPEHRGRLAMIMAGAHSLGTGAACLAATRSTLIQRIRSSLPEGVLEEKNSAFWVLVKGTVSKQDDYLLDPEHVTIEDAGGYG